MKKYTLLYTLLIVFVQFKTIGQYTIRPYNLEVQFGGNAPALGLKLQRNFPINNTSHLTIGAGLGYNLSLGFNHDISYSLGNGKHFLEVGLAGLYTNTFLGNNDKNIFYSSTSKREYYLLPLVGYKRIIRNTYGLRVHFTPLFVNQNFQFWSGISISYYLRKKEPQNLNTGSVRFFRE
jgi:hypothetical protein